jgi:hypothetical protein
MKQYIRTLYLDDPDSANSIKLLLNDYGFYVLTFGNNLEVYAIKEKKYLEELIIDSFKNLFN